MWRVHKKIQIVELRQERRELRSDVRVWIHIYRKYTCSRVALYICIYVYVYVCMYVSCVYVRGSIHVYVYVYVCVYMYICICVASITTGVYVHLVTCGEEKNTGHHEIGYR